jgi:four helix bundle protein
MTLHLPKFEMYEEGSQIRKSSKNVKATFVEGYGRKIYKAEYLKFLVYALASTDETKDHLENLYHTRSLQDHALYNGLHEKIERLGRMIRNFYHWVEENHKPSL